MTSVRLADRIKRRGLKSKDGQSYLHAGVLYLLFLPLPIVDSLNGIVNGGGGENVLTLGMVYRLCIIVYCCAMLARGIIPKRFLVISAAVLLLIGLPHVFDLADESFLSLVVKTLLPVLCIEAFIKDAANDPRACSHIEQLIDCWSTLFPLAMLVPFVLGVGFQTYGEGTVGYKGFFYAQNDLCFVLSVLFFFCCGKTFRRVSVVSVLKVLLVGICIALLGMKSGYILMLVSVFYWIIKSRMTMLRRGVIIFSICILAIIGAPHISEAMSSIIDRWVYFSNTADSFLDFFSSGRLERIPAAFDYLNSTEANPVWFLFGVGMRYSECLMPFGFVEMDPFDLFFQFGIIGALLLIGYYSQFLLIRLPDDKKYYRMALIIALGMSAAAGHVLNSALSAMVLSVLCGLIWATRHNQDDHCEAVGNGR